MGELLITSFANQTLRVHAEQDISEQNMGGSVFPIAKTIEKLGFA